MNGPNRSTRFSNRFLPLAAAVVGAALLLAGCEKPQQVSTQQGYRGTGMVQVTNPRIVAKAASLHDVPEATPQAPADGPKAKEVYQNVKLLGHLSAGEFTRLMVSMTQWIAPAEGCNYCHANGNFADDSNYRKVVARRMLEMTWKVNSDWKAHVAETGVTCYTCHRGQGVPQNTWSNAPAAKHASRMLGNDFGQNRPSASVKLASLPYDPLTPFLEQAQPIRAYSTTALPTGNNPANIKSTEYTYALMMHMSDSLGVNCTFCHNTQSFGKWEGGPPTRVTAWHGIRMARQLNVDYIDPLKDVFPPDREGPLGDPLKVGCSTCHQGVNKPLRGVSMLKDHPELAGAPAK